MTPPPITTSDLGILGKERAPVELMITFSSKSNPGNGVASDPVAMRIFFA